MPNTSNTSNTSNTPRPAHYAHFKALWEHLNRDAVLHYDIDSAALVASAVVLINDKFAVQPLGVQVTTAKGAHEIDALHQVRESTATYQLKPQPIYTLGEFVQALANGTRLSLHTISSILLGMEPHKFAQIKTNENRALRLLQDLMRSTVGIPLLPAQAVAEGQGGGGCQPVRPDDMVCDDRLRFHAWRSYRGCRNAKS